MVNLNNGLLYEFGLDESDFRNVSKFKEKIQEIDETFDLILIMEHFNEAMVILKHVLCWSYDDLANFRLNVHDNSTKTVISEKARNRLKTWLEPSYEFYNYFKVYNHDILPFCFVEQTDRANKIHIYFRPNFKTKSKTLVKTK